MDTILNVVQWAWDHPWETAFAISLLNTITQWTPWKHDDDLVKIVGKFLLRKNTGAQ